ncbi:MAG: radical SAM protein [Bacillota bacterium]|nr:radical SAM protein [Bacillota bacterium]
MRYEGTIYRPPSEANSLLIQATIGCPHNKCTFCSMYKGTKFRVRSVEDIKEDLYEAKEYYGPFVRSLFFPDGNTIIMKTDQLEEIFGYASDLFPHLERITVYGSARFARKKSLEDFIRLEKAGLKRLHMGMESGDNVTLERIKKNSTSEEIIEAGQKIKAANIQLSEYYLVGVGGKERSVEHALESAHTLNDFSPDFIRLRTLVPVPGTPLYDDIQEGRFTLPSPHEALQEIRLLIQNLNCKGSMIISDHVTNYWNINGILPADKDRMLNELDHALSVDESHFQVADSRYL